MTGLSRVFYTHDIFSSQRYGGITRYFLELVPELLKLSTPPTIELFSGLAITGEWIPLLHGFRVPEIANTRFLRHFINEAWQIHRLSVFKPDLIHATYPFKNPESYKHPLIFTVHDMIPELYPQYFSGKDTSSTLKKKFCESASRIISVSHQTKADLINIFGIEETKIDVIHHGVRCPDYKQIKPYTLNKPYLLYVGTQEKYKNFDSVLEAFLGSNFLRKNFYLTVIGTKKPYISESYRRSAEGIVHFLSGNDSILSSLYRGAVALIYPSKYEGFGMPVLEAMAHACPVICSDVAAIREAAGDAAHYIDPNSVESMRFAMESCIREKAALTEQIEKGLLRAASFSWKKTAELTLQSYKKSLGVA